MSLLGAESSGISGVSAGHSDCQTCAVNGNPQLPTRWSPDCKVALLLINSALSVCFLLLQALYRFWDRIHGILFLYSYILILYSYILVYTVSPETAMLQAHLCVPATTAWHNHKANTIQLLIIKDFSSLWKGISESPACER